MDRENYVYRMTNPYNTGLSIGVNNDMDFSFLLDKGV